MHLNASINGYFKGAMNISKVFKMNRQLSKASIPYCKFYSRRFDR